VHPPAPIATKTRRSKSAGQFGFILDPFLVETAFISA
jgi:hypothetical protein